MNDTTGTNGFDQYKQMLLDDRKLNREAHDRIMLELGQLHDDVLIMKRDRYVGGKLFTMAWGAFGAGAFLLAQFVIAHKFGG